MACVHCRLEIPETLCKICGALEQGNFPELSAVCKQCGAPVVGSPDETDLCQVCSALLDIVKGCKWLVVAHAEWEEENIRLAQLKRELLR